MSKVSNMSMAEIFNRVDIKFKLEDISKICSNSEQANRIRELILSGKNHIEVLIDNEEYIDKEKMLLVTWLSYKEDINELKNKLAGDILRNGSNRARIEQEIRDMSNSMLKIKKICRDVDTYLVVVHLKDGLAAEIEIISSREEILGYDLSDIEKKNRRIFDYIDENLLVEPDDLGMKYALQTVELEDFEKAMPYEIAQAVKYMIEFNNIKLGERFTERFLDKKEKGEDTSELNEEFQQEVSLPTVRNAVNEVLRYVDLKKLLLIEIYRIEYELDKAFSNGESISNERLHAAENVASFLLDIIGKDTVLENGDSTYSYEDVLFFLDRISAERNIYITREEAINLKNQLLQGLNIEDIEDADLDKLCMLRYTSEELNGIMNISQANFTFGMTMQDLSEEQIIEKAYQHSDKWSDEITEHFYSEGKLSIHSILGLYYDGIISAEFFKEFSEENDISSEINLTKIQTLHSQIKKQKEPNEEDVEKLNKMIKLYKLINIDEKNEEELADLSECIMYEIAENFEDDNDIIFYYQNGLINLSTVASWSGDILIERLYEEEQITLNNIEKLYEEGKVSNSLIYSICKNLALDINIGQEERVELIIKAHLGEDIIEKLYMDMLIDKEDLKTLVGNNIITTEQKNSIQDKLSLEKAEEESPIKFVIDATIKKISTEKVTDYTDGGKKEGVVHNKSNIIIDPEIREQFFELLGFVKVRPERISENSPFYNYDFYCLLDKEQKINLNTPIIAERYYLDKETEKRYATENATYFFQYGDLMVLSNYAKKDVVVSKKENVVFRASHTIANKNRDGRWAMDVIANVIRTLLSSDLKEYNKDNQGLIILEKIKKIYTPEQIMQIFRMQESIDFGEHLYEIEKIEQTEEIEIPSGEEFSDYNEER